MPDNRYVKIRKLLVGNASREKLSRYGHKPHSPRGVWPGAANCYWQATGLFLGRSSQANAIMLTASAVSTTNGTW